jgi:hypothetical protein
MTISSSKTFSLARPFLVCFPFWRKYPKREIEKQYFEDVYGGLFYGGRFR